jgi:4-coumarate--CoA ligase
MLMFSSGTTGLPKAVQLTHHNVIAEHTLFYENRSKSYDVRRLLVFPFFHVASTPSTMISPFREGVESYVMRRFELEPFFQNVEKFSITEIALVPPMVISIIMSPLREKYSLKSIKNAFVGAAPLAKEPQARLQALLAPRTPFNQIWGMTETSCVASCTPWPDHDDTGSVGRFMNNIDVKLVDDEGKDISAGDTRGELCVRGPIVTRGYFENEEANKRDFDEEGYFHTGDIAYMDGKTEKWYIVDRKKVRLHGRHQCSTASSLFHFV